MKRTNASLLFFLACLASCVPARSLPPQVRVTVELPTTEDPDSWDRKGAEALAQALQQKQTGQFEVATAVSLFPSVFASLPPPGLYTRVVVMTATQNRAMDATSGGVAGYSADDADAAADIVAEELQRRGYRVVERQALNAVLREQGFQQSGMVNQADAVRVGKLAGAEAIVIANVYNTSKDYHQGFQGGTVNVFVDVGGRLLDPSGMMHMVDMGVKMIDVQTAEVVWSENKSAQNAPGAKTSHTELLRNLVSSLSFLPSSSVRVASPKPQVKQAQGILQELGYDPGSIDGRMGKKTREALRQFQHAHNLPETGQIDAATKAVLRKPATKAATQSKPPPAAASPSEAAY